LQEQVGDAVMPILESKALSSVPAPPEGLWNGGGGAVLDRG